MTQEARLEGSKRHTHSGLAAVRPHSVDLGPVNHGPVQAEQTLAAKREGASPTPDMPRIASSIKEVRAFRAAHGVKPPVHQRY